MARVLLGVTGSIAAYRSPDLVKALVAEGHEVRVIATQSAAHFVGLKSLETFSGAAVLSNDIWNSSHEGTDHIRWARWADVTLVYGATANILAKLAHNLCDDFLSLQIAASKNPVFLVPAMNVEMWSNTLLQENVTALTRAGMKFIGPIYGTLACGEVGLGHVASIEEILATIRAESLPAPNYFLNKNVLLSLGSMRTQIDPVRFLQNSSSGQMGLALAEALKKLGAQVMCLAGHVDTPIETQLRSDTTERFNDVRDYEMKLQKLFPACDVFFSAAAVLDFEIEASSKKIERQNQNVLSLNVHPTKDFVAWAAENKRCAAPAQKVIAFALETGEWPEVHERALEKLRRKKADAMIVNRATVDEGPITATTQLKLLWPTGELVDAGPKASKSEAAIQVLLKLEQAFKLT